MSGRWCLVCSEFTLVPARVGPACCVVAHSGMLHGCTTEVIRPVSCIHSSHAAQGRGHHASAVSCTAEDIWEGPPVQEGSLPHLNRWAPHAGFVFGSVGDFKLLELLL